MGGNGTAGQDRRIWFFGCGDADGGAVDTAVLGGKGAHLHEMSRLGLPVPPGFTLPTGLCRLHLAGRLPENLRDDVAAAVERLGETVGRRYGDPEDPLLLSVRSGSPVSLPGMMDTVLNLGLSAACVDGLARRLGHPRFALDCRRRLVQMFGDVVAGIDGARFETLLDESKRARGVATDAELTVEDLEALIDAFLAVYREEAGEPFPEDPIEQLWRSILAVFDSWANPRATTLREIEGVPHDLGTAANVQVMVFGNAGERSGSGVAFTRDPATGEPAAVGEYLPDAQGEDVVSGVRTPRPLTEAQRSRVDGGESLQAWMPEAYAALLDVFATLEERYADMQDMEFTIERGELWVLQTRRGKRTAQGMVRIAHDLVIEGRIDRRTAVTRVEAARLDQLLHPTLAPDARPGGEPLARGLGASPGVAAGRIALETERALAAGPDEPVILVRRETSADDVGAMNAAAGVLTARGGATSHAAVVARGLGTPCIVGCSALEIDRSALTVSVDGRVVREGDWLTIDGATGEVFEGRLATTPAAPSPEFRALMEWADGFRRLGVRANADTPADARRALEFGAEGIGLCRTEHMFFAEDRIRTVREVVVAAAGRRLEPRLDERFRDALGRLFPSQRDDFEAIFAVMEGRPVTIRLLDPPLHEFLPREEAVLAELADALGISRDRVDAIVDSLSETNPMLGHRGCRLGITDPEIYEMQARAIVAAAANARDAGHRPRPEIMIPLVGLSEELERLRSRIDRIVSDIAPALSIPIGTMIELPRAALVAERIAEVADFFSFGTNDLTQTTFGLSRDDAASVLRAYREQGILRRDPFVALDREGVGRLIEIGVRNGRATKPRIPIGLCGEHGGEPSSIEFCHRIGVDYVSCSPYRVPTARLAAAQAAIAEP